MFSFLSLLTKDKLGGERKDNENRNLLSFLSIGVSPIDSLSSLVSIGGFFLGLLGLGIL